VCNNLKRFRCKTVKNYLTFVPRKVFGRIKIGGIKDGIDNKRMKHS